MQQQLWSGSGSGSATGGAGGTGTVNVGAILNLSGVYSAIEQPALDGLKYAVSQINRTGFDVAGKHYKINLVVAPDAAGSSATAVEDARSLISSNGVHFIFGPVSAGASAILPITDASDVMLLTASSTIYQDIGPKQPLLFRVSSDAAYRAQLEVTWVKQQMGSSPKTVAMIGQNDSEGQEFFATNIPEYKAGGIATVYQTLYPVGTTDFTPFLTKIASVHPTALYTGGSNSDSFSQVAQGMQLHLAPNFIAQLTPSQLKDLPASSAKVLELFPAPQFYTPTTPKLAAWINGLKGFLNGQLPAATVDTTFYYDPLFMLVQAMKTAGTVSDTASIAKAFNTITYTGGILGPSLSFQGTYRIKFPVDECAFQSGLFACESVTLDKSGQLQVLGKSSLKVG